MRFGSRRINLQQFGGPMLNAEGVGGAPAGGDIGGSAPTPDTAPAPNSQSWGGVTPEAANPLLQAGSPDVAAAAPEVLDFGGRQVPVVDPSIKEVFNDWQQLNSTYTRTNQELQTYKQQAEQYSQMLQFAQQQLQTQQPAQQAQAEPQPEPFDREQFFEQFYEDPETAFSKLSQSYQKQLESKLGEFESRFNQYVEPMVKERQVNEQLSGLSQKYPDLREFAGQMSQLENQQPGLADKVGLENLYLMAKGMTAQQAPTPDQLLQDPGFRNRILSDQSFQQEVMKQYMSQKQQSNQQLPNVMGTQIGGQSPTMQANTPKTLGEASRAFAKSLGL